MAQGAGGKAARDECLVRYAVPFNAMDEPRTPRYLGTTD
jgi:hypothetical protein